jgi:hypothetical protein
MITALGRWHCRPATPAKLKLLLSQEISNTDTLKAATAAPDLESAV